MWQLIISSYQIFPVFRQHALTFCQYRVPVCRMCLQVLSWNNASLRSDLFTHSARPFVLLEIKITLERTRAKCHSSLDWSSLEAVREKKHWSSNCLPCHTFWLEVLSYLASNYNRNARVDSTAKRELGDEGWETKGWELGDLGCGSWERGGSGWETVGGRKLTLCRSLKGAEFS